jgi:hypothetical protein
MGVEELQSVQVQFDRAPRVGGQQIGEIVGQRIDPVLEIVAGPAEGAGISLDGLRLQALELDMLEVGLVKAVEVRCRWSSHVLQPREFPMEFPLLGA